MSTKMKNTRAAAPKLGTTTRPGAALTPTDRAMNLENKSRPGLGQYVLAGTLGVLAISAGGISLSMNVAFGMKTGLVMAAIFALSDGAKIIMPMIGAALGGMSAKHRAAYAVAVIISIFAATSYLLETQATRLLQSQARETALTTARTDAERLRSDLAGISEPMSVSALERLVASKKAAIDRESARGGCGPACEALQGERDGLVERLGLARRRDSLKSELKALSDAVAAPVEALGASTTLAGLTGGDAARIAQAEGIVKAVLMLIILELIAMFSGDAGNLFVRTWKARKTRKSAIAKKSTANVVANLQMQAVAAQPKSGTREWYLARLRKDHATLASRVDAGELSVYRACIEAGLRKAPKKSAKWTKPDAYMKAEKVTG